MADFAQARRIMVDCQVRPSDVTDLRIIAAMLEIPRERFVAPSQSGVAYLDVDVPAAEGSGRALLKPMVFSKLLQAAGIGASDRVLDAGCATGYSSAVLSQLAGSVVALEEDAALASAASSNLAALGAANVTVVTGSIAAGWPQGGPYDAIVLEGGSEIVPEALLAQLKDGGRLLAVVGTGPMGKATIYRIAGAHATAQPLFDAAASLLPGFVKPAEFVF
jgi:protein-L-isoaspartate(D-aspartate) O-methyltransferase